MILQSGTVKSGDSMTKEETRVPAAGDLTEFMRMFLEDHRRMEQELAEERRRRDTELMRKEKELSEERQHREEEMERRMGEMREHIQQLRELSAAARLEPRGQSGGGSDTHRDH